MSAGIVAAWVVLPLALLHVVLWRHRKALRFQFLLDGLLVVLFWCVLARGLLLSPVRVIGDVAPYRGWAWSGETTLRTDHSDLVLQYGPWWEEVRRLIAERELPWLAPHIAGGAPLYANGQSGLLAPVMLPVWVLGPERGATVMAVWKVELAALGTFLLLTVAWRLRWVAAAAGAVAFGFSQFVVGWLPSPLSWSLAILPWAWWLVHGAVRGRSRGGRVLGAGLLLGWFMGAGLNPEYAAVASGSALLYGLCLHPRRWRRLLALGGFATVVTLGLAWPTLRTVAASSKMAAYADINPNVTPIPWSLRREALLQTLAPMAQGDPRRGTWTGAYPWSAGALGVGGAALALLAAGSVRRRHRRLLVAGTAMLAVAAVLAFRLPPLDALLVRVPPFNRLTLPRFALLVPWGLAILVAASLDGALARGRLRAAAWGTVPLLAVAGGLGRHAGWGTVDWLLAESTAAAAALVLLAARRRPAWALPVVLAEVLVLGFGVNPTAAPADALPTPPVLRRIVDRVEGTGGRVVALGGVLPANLASRYGLTDLRAFDPIRPWPLARLHALMGAADPVLPGPLDRAPPRLCGAFAVRYLLTPAGWSAPGWARIDGGDGVWIWENPVWQPAVRLVGRTVAPGGESGWALLARDPPLLASGAVVPAGTPPASARVMSLTVVSRSPVRLEAEVGCDGPCLLVLAQPWTPGWHARLDGTQVAVVRANLAGLGVLVPAGSHRAVLEYHPWW